MKSWKEHHKSELDEERKLIEKLADVYHLEIIKLQGSDDDGGTDGELADQYGKIYVEVRRKGFPNHNGKTTPFNDGWNTYFLKHGIYLNEITIKRYIENGFLFLVEIKNYPPRCAGIGPKRVKELLQQPKKHQRSTNSGIVQSVKLVPLEWFKNI